MIGQAWVNYANCRWKNIGALNAHQASERAHIEGASQPLCEKLIFMRSVYSRRLMESMFDWIGPMTSSAVTLSSWIQLIESEFTTLFFFLSLTNLIE